jgi:hypothetical protein
MMEVAVHTGLRWSEQMGTPLAGTATRRHRIEGLLEGPGEWEELELDLVAGLLLVEVDQLPDPGSHGDWLMAIEIWARPLTVGVPSV